MVKLTPEQIEAVITWMNTWEQLKDTAIPIRFKEDFSKPPQEPCPNCKETKDPCRCMLNMCNKCGKPVGNITFTVCDDCWDKKHNPVILPQCVESSCKNDAICGVYCGVHCNCVA